MRRHRAALWDDVAYISRYGHQPLSEIIRLDATQRREFVQALSRIVSRENEKKD